MAEESPAEREERLQRQEERLAKQHQRLQEGNPPRGGGGGGFGKGIAGIGAFLGEHKIIVLGVIGFAIVAYVFFQASKNKNANTANQAAGSQQMCIDSSGNSAPCAGLNPFAMDQLTQQLNQLQRQVTTLQDSVNKPPPTPPPPKVPPPPKPKPHHHPREKEDTAIERRSVDNPQANHSPMWNTMALADRAVLDTDLSNPSITGGAMMRSDVGQFAHQVGTGAAPTTSGSGYNAFPDVVLHRSGFALPPGLRMPIAGAHVTQFNTSPYPVYTAPHTGIHAPEGGQGAKRG